MADIFSLQTKEKRGVKKEKFPRKLLCKKAPDQSDFPSQIEEIRKDNNQ